MCLNTHCYTNTPTDSLCRPNSRPHALSLSLPLPLALNQYIGVFGTAHNRRKVGGVGGTEDSEKMDMTAPVISVTKSSRLEQSEPMSMTAPVLSAGAPATHPPTHPPTRSMSAAVLHVGALIHSLTHSHPHPTHGFANTHTSTYTQGVKDRSGGDWHSYYRNNIASPPLPSHSTRGLPSGIYYHCYYMYFYLHYVHLISPHLPHGLLTTRM
jgi:hypothetical protein